MQPRKFVAGVLRRSALAAGLSLLSAFAAASADEQAFIPRLVNSSTVPPNGDVNPYGVAFVPAGFPSGGTLAVPGNAVAFFTSQQGGLSTALGALRGGFVIVGNVPTRDGSFTTIGSGSLQILDGATAHIFVANVLNGTVSRLDVAVSNKGVTLLKKLGLDAVSGRGARFNYAAIDDVTNNLSVYRLPVD